MIINQMRAENSLGTGTVIFMRSLITLAADQAHLIFVQRYGKVGLVSEAEKKDTIRYGCERQSEASSFLSDKPWKWNPNILISDYWIGIFVGCRSSAIQFTIYFLSLDFDSRLQPTSKQFRNVKIMEYNVHFSTQAPNAHVFDRVEYGSRVC